MNKITVAQEHTATSITEDAIAAIYSRQVSSAIQRGSMVVTGVLGEVINWRESFCQYYGGKWLKVPLSRTQTFPRLRTRVHRASPVDLLFISTTLVANLPAGVGLVRSIRSKLKEPPLKIFWVALPTNSLPLTSRRNWCNRRTDLRGALTMLCGPALSYGRQDITLILGSRRPASEVFAGTPLV